VIAALEPEIADARAKQTMDAKGKLVVPGLVDMHAHVYPQVSALGCRGRAGPLHATTPT